MLSALSKQFPIFRRLEVRLHGAVLSAEYRFATHVRGGVDSSSSSPSSDSSSSNSNIGGSFIFNAINRHKSLLRSFYTGGVVVMAAANIVAPLYLLKAIYGLFFPSPDLPTFQQSQVEGIFTYIFALLIHFFPVFILFILVLFIAFISSNYDNLLFCYLLIVLVIR